VSGAKDTQTCHAQEEVAGGQKSDSPVAPPPAGLKRSLLKQRWVDRSALRCCCCPAPDPGVTRTAVAEANARLQLPLQRSMVLSGVGLLGQLNRWGTSSGEGWQ
jgi:hypothetical protein